MPEQGDEDATALVRRWARGLTDEDIKRMSDDVAKAAAKYAAFAEVLAKIKQAEDTGLSHVVLAREEILSLMWGLRTLTSKKRDA